MTSEFNEAALFRLNEYLSNQIGLFCPTNRLDELEKHIKAAAKECDMEPAEFVHGLVGEKLSKEQIEILAHHLTVGETYFFRDPRTFEILEDKVLWKLIQERRRTQKYLRLWSAGCCSGEEPYTLAIMLKRMIPDISSWSILILASDINPAFLKKAKRGIYSDWSFRVTPPLVKEKFFTRSGKDKFQISEEIRSMVTFSAINLADERYPGVVASSMDIIFCRNVLMYFHPQQAMAVMIKLHQALVETGVMVINPAEFVAISDQMFEPYAHRGAILLKKPSHSFEGSYALDQATDHKPKAEAAPLFHPLMDALALSVNPPPAHLQPAERQWQIASSLPQIPDALPAAERTEAVPLSFQPALVGPGIVESKRDKSESIDVAERARQYFDQGKYKECAMILLEICKPDSELRHLTMLAKAFSNQGDLAQALKWIDHAIVRDKLSHSLYYIRATILQALGQPADAITSLRQALFINSSFVVAEFHLASLLQQSGKTQESARRFKSALKLLKQYSEDEIVPDSEGITAGRLTQIVESLLTGTRV